MGVLSPRHVAEREESLGAVSEPADDESERGRVVEAYEMRDEERESEPERVRTLLEERVCT
jgi:hypothetical protein